MKKAATGDREEVAFLKSKNLWGQVGEECLSRASSLLKAETTPTAATVGVVKVLVEIACMIDELNLRWEQQKSEF